MTLKGTLLFLGHMLNVGKKNFSEQVHNVFQSLRGYCLA
ncbi:hypothetical protein N783_16095 [Pontibacillus marinus BH030004 = DSM 16465]|uniref:Uncharacterized protein n=1 Tax=Pontibacillus marinus BH030004 = DSM 16465 TaxID=1385511 RepID=A0A0A5HMA1_9BACI|nr:hypothetical protein N783_16095 [Pontibacillus marinus BH030004 = DSM 16465]